MQLTNEDRKYCLRHVPKNVLAAMREAGPDLVLAGGLIRSVIANERINDIDLFVRSKEAARVWIDKLANGAKVHETDNAFSVHLRRMFVQIIHRWTYDTPESIVPSFDFTVARAAIWFNGSGWTSLCDDRFYIDLAARRLVYCCPDRNEDAGGSLLRVLKFYQRGYRIPLDSLGAVLARLLKGVDQESPVFWCGHNKRDEGRLPEVEIEAYRAKIVTGLLREVDPNVDPEHASHLSSLETNEAETNDGE